MKYRNKYSMGLTKVAALFLIIMAGAAFTNELQAQQRLQMKIGYNVGVPIGTFHDFISKTSFRGYTASIDYSVMERLRVGLGVSYNDFYEKIPRQTYETKDGTISAVISNSVQSTPIQLKAAYDLTTSTIRPYVGIGLGGNLVGYAQYLGEFGDRTYTFKPSASAEAGVNIPFNRDRRTSGINVGAHFNYLPYNKNNLDNLNNWGVHAAIFFPLK